MILRAPPIWLWSYHRKAARGQLGQEQWRECNLFTEWSDLHGHTNRKGDYFLPHGLQTHSVEPLPLSPLGISHKLHSFSVTFIYNNSLIIQNSFSGSKNTTLDDWQLWEKEISSYTLEFCTINSSINQKFHVTSDSKLLPFPGSGQAPGSRHQGRGWGLP